MKAKTDFKSTGYFEGNHRGAQAQTLTKPWFKSQLCQLLALWPWLSCLISLCLSLFCKMRTIRVPPSLEVVWESEMTLGVLYSVHAQCYPCSVQYKGWWSAVLLAFRGNNFWGFSVLEVKKLEVLVSLDFLSQQMIAWITLCAVSHILPFATCLHQQNADGNRTIKKKNEWHLSKYLITNIWLQQIFQALSSGRDLEVAFWKKWHKLNVQPLLFFNKTPKSAP